jgi:hypothetical protein
MNAVPRCTLGGGGTAKESPVGAACRPPNSTPPPLAPCAADAEQRLEHAERLLSAGCLLMALHGAWAQAYCLYHLRTLKNPARPCTTLRSCRASTTALPHEGRIHTPGAQYQRSPPARCSACRRPRGRPPAPPHPGPSSRRSAPAAEPADSAKAINGGSGRRLLPAQGRKPP